MNIYKENSFDFSESIVFINSNIDNYQTLIPDNSNAEIVILDSFQNGVEQITKELAQYQNLESIHIFSHGSQGVVELGNVFLDQTTLDQYQSDLKSWGNALTENGDLLLYGCQIGAGAEGFDYASQISNITQADVAVSDDITGYADLGGDWELEVTTGDIEAALTSESYQGILLSAHYRFDDEDSTAIAIDSVAENNGNLINFNNLDRVDAPFNKGLSFDGTDDYVSVPNSSSLDLSNGQFTQAVWIRPDIDDEAFYGVLGHQVAGGSETRYPSIWVTQKTKIHAGFGDGTNWNAFLTDDVLIEDSWNHVATTFDGTTYAAYVNGQQVFKSDRYAGRTPVNTEGFDIGRVNNYFQGDIDDVRIYDRALTPVEIDSLLTGADIDTDSSAGLIGLGNSQFFVDENAGQVNITLERIDGDRGAATLFYQTLEGEAIDTQDFTGTESKSISFADGQTSATFTIPIINDSLSEGNETFTVSLFRVEGAELGAPRTAVITILDDDLDQSSLEAYYRFDDTGIIAIDSVAGNDASLINFSNPERIDAPFNTGLSFDGTDDYVSVPNSPNLDLGNGQFTQAVWIRPDINDEAFYGVLGYQAAGGSKTRYPSIWVTQKTKIHAGFGDGTNWNAFLTDDVLIEDSWNHVATTFDGTTYAAYVNGQQVFESDRYAGRTPVNTEGFDIGRVNNYFQGDIDDVRIYDRALTPVEIDSLLTGADIPPIPVQNNFVANTFASGLASPTIIDWLPDGRMLVTEKEGLVRVVGTDGTLEAQPFIDIRERVNSGPRDRGLLGLAVHPDFANNPYIYLSYSYDPPEVLSQSGAGGADGNGARVARIVRVTADASNNFSTVVPDSEVILVGENSTYENIGTPNRRPELEDPHSCEDANGNPIDSCIGNDESTHSIGDLEFGTDGYLYASVGDGGSFGRVDPINLRALDIDSLAGKILRIDPITGDGLSDNPFYNDNPDANRSKVYQYGLRNPFRFAIDPTDGDVVIGEVGWTRWEEINFGEPGANFGWPAFEGGDTGNLQTGGYQDLAQVQAFYATNPNVTAPIWARSHSDGARAIVMGDFNTGLRYPSQYYNGLFFTDFGDGGVLRVANFNPDGSIKEVEVVSDSLGAIVDIAAGPSGYLYLTDFASGTISNLIYA